MTYFRLSNMFIGLQVECGFSTRIEANILFRDEVWGKKGRVPGSLHERFVGLDSDGVEAEVCADRISWLQDAENRLQAMVDVIVGSVPPQVPATSSVTAPAIAEDADDPIVQPGAGMLARLVPDLVSDPSMVHREWLLGGGSDRDLGGAFVAFTSENCRRRSVAGTSGLKEVSF